MQGRELRKVSAFLGLGGGGVGAEIFADAFADALAEAFALVGGHAAAASFRGIPETVAAGAMPAETAEEDAAEREQADGFPEGELMPAEERGHQPIPKVKDDQATDECEENDSQKRQWNDEEHFQESSSHVASLRFRKVVVNALQTLAEMQNGVAFARE